MASRQNRSPQRRRRGPALRRVLVGALAILLAVLMVLPALISALGSARAVSEGDVAAQGEVIGYVGTTGDSMGNHLHLEVRIGGSRVDPQSVYPNVSFYYV